MLSFDALRACWQVYLRYSVTLTVPFPDHLNEIHAQHRAVGVKRVPATITGMTGHFPPEHLPKSINWAKTQISLIDTDVSANVYKIYINLKFECNQVDGAKCAKATPIPA